MRLTTLDRILCVRIFHTQLNSIHKLVSSEYIHRQNGGKVAHIDWLAYRSQRWPCESLFTCLSTKRDEDKNDLFGTSSKKARLLTEYIHTYALYVLFGFVCLLYFIYVRNGTAWAHTYIHAYSHNKHITICFAIDWLAIVPRGDPANHCSPVWVQKGCSFKTGRAGTTVGFWMVVSYVKTYIPRCGFTYINSTYVYIHIIHTHLTVLVNIRTHTDWTKRWPSMR